METTTTDGTKSTTTTSPNNYSYGYNNAQWDGEISRDILGTIWQNSQATNVAIEKIGAAGILESAKDSALTQSVISDRANSLANLTLNGFNQSRTDLFQGLALASTERVKFAGESALTAAVNTAALQASLAACCCEIKALVLSESSAGRDLQRSIEASRSAIDLIDAKNEILALRVIAKVPA